MVRQIKHVFFISFFVLFFCSYSQEKETDPFEIRLNKFIKEKKLRIYTKEIQQEKFIVELMQHITYEIRSRYPDYIYSGNEYYRNLEQQLIDVDGIVNRLSASGGDDLVGFARELRERILNAVKSPKIQTEKEAFFKKSIQLLLLAEKAIASGNVGQLQETESEFKRVFRKQVEEKKELSKEEKKSSIFDLFYQWDNASLTKYLVREGKLRYYQQKLVKTGTNAERIRMAKDLFERSLFSFNSAEYELSADLLENLLKNYEFLNSKDKIQYYLGLSYFYNNQFEYAEKNLEAIVTSSVFDHYTAIALLKIYKNNDKVDKVNGLLSRFTSFSSTINFQNNFYFEIGKYLFDKEQYKNAATAFSSIQSTYSLYHDARYFLALSKFPESPEESKQILNQLINNSDIHPQLRGDCLLKLAYMSYESANYNDAIYWFGEISESYDGYDAALLATAWTYYEIENLKKNEQERNYGYSKYYIDRVMKTYKNSEYINESKALLGYIKQKEKNIIGAEKEFKHIFESVTYKNLSDKFLKERDSLKQVRKNVDALMVKAIEKKDRAAFNRLDNILYNIDKKLYKLKYMDFSSVSPTRNSDVNVLSRQISEFERLREKALAKEDEELVARIDDNLLRLYTVLNRYKGSKKSSLFGYNYFQEQPLARKVSLLENMFKNYQKIADSGEEQKKTIKVKIQNLNSERVNAKTRNDYEKLAKIDMMLYRLNNQLQKIDFIQTYSKNKKEAKTAANLDYWSNYGAYQLTNIQYIQQKRIDEDNLNTRKVLTKIDNILEERNLILQEKIKSIEGTILVMNRRVAKNRRIQEREQKKKFFETEFFDESTSEVNEDSLRLAMENRALNMMKNIPLKANTDSTISDSLSKNLRPENKDGSGENTPTETSDNSSSNEEAVKEEE